MPEAARDRPVGLGLDFRNGSDIGDYRFKILDRLVDGKRVNFAADALAGLERGFQVVSGDFDGEFVGDHPASAVLIDLPRGQGQSDGDRASAHQEVDVDRIGVARGDGHDQRLVDAVQFLPAPAIGGAKAFVHKKTIADRASHEQTVRLEEGPIYWTDENDGDADVDYRLG